MMNYYFNNFTIPKMLTKNESCDSKNIIQPFCFGVASLNILILSNNQSNVPSREEVTPNPTHGYLGVHSIIDNQCQMHEHRLVDYTSLLYWGMLLLLPLMLMLLLLVNKKEKEEIEECY